MACGLTYESQLDMVTGLAEQSGQMACAWIGLRKSDGQGDWVSRPEQLDEFNVAYERQLNTAMM